jgi:uncharacterized membrane protein
MPRATVRASRVPVALAVAVVLLQIAYPLVHGTDRDHLTVLTVVVLFAASAGHAVTSRGPAWAARAMTVLLGVGLLAEAVGVATGYPFGSYAYADSLGPQLLGVPLVVPLAWAMLGYPCLVVGQHLAPGLRGAAISAVALAGWDLFLDPQLVAAGHWRWDHPHPGLNGIPLTNSLGWLVVALLMMSVLTRVPAADDRVPGALFLWTYGSSVIANLAFFGRPGVALAGGIGMGLVAVPYAVKA